MEGTREYTINQALAVSGLSNNYIRKAISSGALKVRKELVPGTKNNWRNVIVNFDEWRATRNHSQRDDGRTKYVLYMLDEEAEKVQEFLKTLELDTLTKAFVKKEEDQTEEG